MPPPLSLSLPVGYGLATPIASYCIKNSHTVRRAMLIDANDKSPVAAAICSYIPKYIYGPVHIYTLYIQRMHCTIHAVLLACVYRISYRAILASLTSDSIFCIHPPYCSVTRSQNLSTYKISIVNAMPIRW